MREGWIPTVNSRIARSASDRNCSSNKVGDQGETDRIGMGAKECSSCLGKHKSAIFLINKGDIICAHTPCEHVTHVSKPVDVEREESSTEVCSALHISNDKLVKLKSSNTRVANDACESPYR